MKIHYSTTVWHAGFTEFFGRALQSLGHEVIFFDNRGTKLQKLFDRIATRFPRFSYKGDDLFREAVSRDWVRAVHDANPDLILLQDAINVLPEAICEARKFKKPIFYWVHCAVGSGASKAAIAGLQYVDKIFTLDRSEEFMSILYLNRQHKTEFLPLAGDPDFFHPLTPQPKKEYDVAFIGSFPPQSGDGYLRAKIINDIPKKYRVGVSGAGLEYWYKYFPDLAGRRIRNGGRLSPSVLNETYNKTKILLAIHSTTHINSISARTFEAALAGIFQIVDYRTDLDELFPKDTFVTFKSADEIMPLIDRWLAPGTDEGRERFITRAREHVLAHHTWRHRAEEMLKHVKDIASSKN